jgi:hypothetical protein
LTIYRPGADGWREIPASRRWRRLVDLVGGLVELLVGRLNRWPVWGLFHRSDLWRRLSELWQRLGDLLTAEPPVVFIRVVRPVIEAPTRRGFAFSHILMLTLSCSAVANQALSTPFCASKC